MLKLDTIVSLLPHHWPRHAPAGRAHIERALRDPVSAAVIRTNPGRFPGICDVPRYFYPDASEEALLLGLELNIWYFYFDDPFDDGDISLTDRAAGEALVERMVALLDTGVLPREPSALELLCLQFRERARRMCVGRPRTWRRFIDACIHWTDSVLPAATTQQEAALPDLTAYDAARGTNIGILPLAYINEIDGPLQFADAFYAQPAVQRMHALTCLVIIHCNDLYSYEKERQLSERPFNSLFLRQHHHGLGLADAFAAHLTGISGWLTELDGLEQSALEGCSDLDIRRTRSVQTQYIRRLQQLILGNHLWSIHGGRYSSPTSPFAELRVGGQGPGYFTAVAGRGQQNAA